MKGILGALLLVSGTTFFGMAAAGHLRRRTETLTALVSAMDFLQSEIQFCLHPLPVIMIKLAKQYPKLATLFEPCGQDITSETGFAERWKSALKTSELPLKPAEILVLQEVGSILGRYDADGQQQALQQSKLRLSEMMMMAKEEQAAKSRLFSFLGVAAGLLLIILAI